ncbi:MAG: hypothetical protein WBN81_12260 [Gammaproteobacteria bacterium]
MDLVESGTVGCGFACDIWGRFAVKCSVHTMSVVILTECFQFSFQVTGIPEEHLVKELPTNGSDQPFDEGMR